MISSCAIFARKNTEIANLDSLKMHTSRIRVRTDIFTRETFAPNTPNFLLSEDEVVEIVDLTATECQEAEENKVVLVKLRRMITKREAHILGPSKTAQQNGAQNYRSEGVANQRKTQKNTAK